jgi:hypothetical protein
VNYTEREREREKYIKKKLGPSVLQSPISSPGAHDAVPDGQADTANHHEHAAEYISGDALLLMG